MKQKKNAIFRLTGLLMGRCLVKNKKFIILINFLFVVKIKKKLRKKTGLERFFWCCCSTPLVSTDRRLFGFYAFIMPFTLTFFFMSACHLNKVCFCFWFFQLKSFVVVGYHFKVFMVLASLEEEFFLWPGSMFGITSKHQFACDCVFSDFVRFLFYWCSEIWPSRWWWWQEVSCFLCDWFNFWSLVRLSVYSFNQQSTTATTAMPRHATYSAMMKMALFLSKQLQLVLVTLDCMNGLL